VSGRLTTASAGRPRPPGGALGPGRPAAPQAGTYARRARISLREATISSASAYGRGS
jgi:hypothetical protein